MKKESEPIKPAKKTANTDPDMGQVLSEKDEVKKAEERMRKSMNKSKGK